MAFSWFSVFHIFLPHLAINTSVYDCFHLYASPNHTSRAFSLAYYIQFLLHPIFLSKHLHFVTHAQAAHPMSLLASPLSSLHISFAFRAHISLPCSIDIYIVVLIIFLILCMCFCMRKRERDLCY